MTKGKTTITKLEGNAVAGTVQHVTVEYFFKTGSIGSKNSLMTSFLSGRIMGVFRDYNGIMALSSRDNFPQSMYFVLPFRGLFVLQSNELLIVQLPYISVFQVIHCTSSLTRTVEILSYFIRCKPSHLFQQALGFPVASTM